MESKPTTQRIGKFELGVLVITPGAAERLTTGEVVTALARHARGDWGILTPDDWQENETALREGGRLFSVYDIVEEEGHYYIITESDRSVTTVLLPDEY